MQLNANTEPFKTAAIAPVITNTRCKKDKAFVLVLVLSSSFAFSYLFWKAGGFYRETLGCNWENAKEEYQCYRLLIVCFSHKNFVINSGRSENTAKKTERLIVIRKHDIRVRIFFRIVHCCQSGRVKKFCDKMPIKVTNQICRACWCDNGSKK